MANKETIQDVDEKLEALHRRLMRIINAIDHYRKKRKRMVTGKIKVPPPPPKIVKWQTPAFDDRLDDLHPVAPGSSGPC